jgi:hypothetical protein
VPLRRASGQVLTTQARVSLLQRKDWAAGHQCTVQCPAQIPSGPSAMHCWDKPLEQMRARWMLQQPVFV